MKTRHWQDAAVFVIGLWIFVSPWVFGNALVAQAPEQALAGAWSLWIGGIAVLLVAGMALGAFRVWQEWANLGLGIWLLVAPWILEFGSAVGPAWNTAVSGLAVLAFAGWTLAEHGGPDPAEYLPERSCSGSASARYW